MLGLGAAQRSASDPESLFRSVRLLKALERAGPRLLDPTFWQAINPDLTITDRPPAQGVTAFDSAWASGDDVRQRLIREGVAISPAIVPRATVASLSAAVERLVATGLPPGFALVYDEFLQLIAGLLATWVPLLGPNVVMLPRDFWVFYVPAGDPHLSATAAFGPHRDALAPDPMLQAEGRPSILNVWLALGDVSTDDSCIYVMPADVDPDYQTVGMRVDATGWRLQDIRALPVSAGQAVMFDPHLAHWGSRGSALGTHARISLAGFIQGADGPYPRQSATDLSETISLERRVRWALHSLTMAINFDTCADLARRVGISDITQP